MKTDRRGSFIAAGVCFQQRVVILRWVKGVLLRVRVLASWRENLICLSEMTKVAEIVLVTYIPRT